MSSLLDSSLDKLSKIVRISRSSEIRSEIRFVGISLLLGACTWLIDAIVDHVFFPEATFFQLLVTVHPHEAYMRSVMVGGFVVFGLVAAQLDRRRRQVEREGRQKLERAHREWVSSFDAVADPIFLHDRQGHILQANRAYTNLTGRSVDEVIGMAYWKVFPQGDGPLPGCRRALEGQEEEIEEIKLADGKIFQSRAFAVRYAGEGYQHSIHILEDITEARRAEQSIRASLAEKEILLREIHHRVKNNLQVVSSLLKLQASAIRARADAPTLEAFHESQNRIHSMSLVHERLYHTERLTNVDFHDYIQELVPELLQAYSVEDGQVVLHIDAQNVGLGIDQAIPCGLIVNELVSNSLKHAFPEGRRGKIEVVLRPYGTDQLELIVGDDGVGFPVSVDWRNTKTLGLRLVNTLTRQLNGEVELDQSGNTQFYIRFRRDNDVEDVHPDR